MSDPISIIQSLDPKLLATLVGGVLAGGVGVAVGKTALAGALRIIGSLVKAKAKSTPDKGDDEVAEEVEKTLDKVAEAIDRGQGSIRKE